MSKLENSLKDYYNFFDVNYPLGITSFQTDNEIIEDIEKAIKKGEKIENELKEGVVY